MNRAAEWLRVRRNYVALWTLVFGSWMTWLLSQIARLHGMPLDGPVTWGIALAAGLTVGWLSGVYFHRVHGELPDRFRRGDRR